MLATRRPTTLIAPFRVRALASRCVMSGRLTGHRALVTGGARGIGRTIAMTLATEGADVGIGYLSSGAAARRVVAGIRKAGVTGSAIRADVTKDADVKRLVATT